MHRILSVFLEPGKLDLSVGSVAGKCGVTINAVQSAESFSGTSLADKLKSLRLLAEADGEVSEGFTLAVNKKFYGAGMESLGRELWRQIDETASEAEALYFTYLRTCLADLLNPSLGMYYLSRSGQTSPRQAICRHFLPFLFNSKKKNYMAAARWELEFDLSCPQELMDQLMARGGSTTTILGIKERSNVEDDECQETMGVKSTKQTPSAGIENSLRVGVYTHSNMEAGPSRAEAEIAPITKETVAVDSCPSVGKLLRNRRRMESRNVQEIAKVLHGAGPDSTDALLDEEHMASVVLMNRIVQLNLRLTLSEIDGELNRSQAGVVTTSDYFNRTLRGYRKIGDSGSTSISQAVPGFAGEFDRVKTIGVERGEKGLAVPTGASSQDPCSVYG